MVATEKELVNTALDSLDDAIVAHERACGCHEAKCDTRQELDAAIFAVRHVVVALEADEIAAKEGDK